jgi:hypothetical protein
MVERLKTQQKCNKDLIDINNTLQSTIESLQNDIQKLKDIPTTSTSSSGNANDTIDIKDEGNGKKRH